MKPKLSSLTHALILALLIAGAWQAQAQSSNKAFFLGTNNSLRPSETNFFAVNSNLLNASVAATNGGGGGGGGGGNSNYFAAGTNLVIVTNSGASGATNIISVAAAVLTNNEAGNVGFAANLTVGGELFANETLITNLNALYATISPTSGVGLTINGDSGGVHNIMQLFSFSSSGEFIVDNAGNPTVSSGAYFKGSGAGLTNLPGSAFAPGTTITGNFSGNASGATNLNNLAFAGPTQAVTNGEVANTTLNGALTLNGYQTNGATIYTTASSLHPALSLASAGQSFTLGYGAAINSTGPANFNSFSDGSGFSTSAGSVTAVQFNGSGAGLTNMPVSGNAPSLSNNVTGSYNFIHIPAFTNNFGPNSLTNCSILGGQTIWNLTGTNTLLVIGTNSGFTSNYLIFTNWATTAPYWTIHCQVQAVSTVPYSPGSDSVGIKFGLQDTFGAGWDFFFDLVENYANISAYQGVINSQGSGPGVSYGNYGPSSVTGGAQQNQLSFSAGQWLDVTVSRYGYQCQVVWSNTVNGSVVDLTCPLDLQAYTNGILPNTGYVTIGCDGGTNLVTNLTFTVDCFAPVTMLVAGASITQGSGASSPETTSWGAIRKVVGPGVYIEAGGGDGTAQLVQCIPEFNLLLSHSTNVATTFILAGDTADNDQFYGTNFGVTTTNTTNILQSVLASNWFVGTPFPKTNFDATPLVTWTMTNFPSSKVINTFQPFTDASSYLANLYFYYSDGQHLNDKGQSMAATLFKRKLLLPP